MVTLVTLLLAFSTALTVVRARRRREETRRFGWQFGTYDGGRVVHLVPIGDGLHIEDHPSDCSCSPWSERFQRGYGSYGSVIYHQRVRS